MEKKTVSEIYLEWRNFKRRLVTESSFATYSINIEKHVLPALGDCSEVDNGTVQDFALNLAAKGLAPNTVKSILLVLGMLLDFGWRHGWAERPDMRISMPKEARRPMLSVLDIDDQRTLMAYLTNHRTPRNVGIYICLCTGLRIGELCGLRWGDIDLRLKQLAVRRTVGRVYSKEGDKWGTHIVVGPPKTQNSLRNIPISASLAAMLRPMARKASPEAYVLTGDDKPLEPRICRHYYKRLMQQLGMPQVRFHALRHTFATRCIETDSDCKTVSALLGHANVSTTLSLYVHPDMNLKRKCIDRMLRALK